MENSNINQNTTQNAAYAPPQGQVPPPPFVPPRPAYAPKLKWPPIAGNVFDSVFMILTLVFSVFAVHAVLFAGFFKLGFTVAYVAWFILENIYIFTKNKPKLHIYPLLLGLLSLCASGVFALFNDEVINFSLLLCIAFSNAEYFMLMSKQERFPAGEISSLIDAARYVMIIPIQFFTEPFRSAFTKENGVKNKRGSKTVQVLIGIGISIPLVAILIALLSSADAAFKGLIEKLFSNLLFSLLKLILGVIVFPLLLSPAFALRYKMPNRAYKAPTLKNHEKFPSAVSVTILAVISSVYVIYLLSQLAYFFDAFKGILPEDYSASEYARRGFFEMCAICTFNVLFIALSMAFAKKDSKGSVVIHKILQIFIALASLVVAASSFSKMYLYIKIYGLTRKRILTSVFILLVSVVVLSLIVRILFKKFPYMKTIVPICFAILIAVGFIDIDTQIAKYNYNLYTNNTEIAAHLEKDGGFIDELGDSATEYIAKFAKEGKGDVQKRAQAWLCDMWCRENVKDYDSPMLSKSNTPLSYNKARCRASKVLDAFNKEYHFDTFMKYFRYDGEYDYDYTKAMLALPKNCQEYCYNYYCALNEVE